MLDEAVQGLMPLRTRAHLTHLSPVFSFSGDDWYSVHEHVTHPPRKDCCTASSMGNFQGELPLQAEFSFLSLLLLKNMQRDVCVEVACLLDTVVSLVEDMGLILSISMLA